MITSDITWNELYSSQEKFKSYFNDIGFIWVKNFIESPDQFQEIVDRYTLTYSNDAARRSNRFGKSKIKNVDYGFGEIPLHSESSFSPNCPEIIWFYCVHTPSYSSESTKICDGSRVWNKLSKSTKHFLLSNPIEYELSIDLGREISNREWFINRPGCGNAFINEGRLNFTSKRYAVNELFDSSGKSYIAFANHLFAPLEQETQILSRKVKGQEIPSSLIQECNEICKEETKDILWESGDFIFLNNKRFMHGRGEINKDSRRDIVISLTEKATF